MSKLIVLPLFLFFCFSDSASQKESESAYLDYAASWKVGNASLGEFLKTSELIGNSSGINAHAKHLRKLEERAAKVIADKIGAAPNQIHFTSGSTVANNIAILGVAYKNPKCRLITSKIEHKSVLNVFKHLETLGYKVTYLDVDQYGNIDLNQLRECIRNDTKLISIQMFNSEIGTLQNMEAIGRIAKERGVLFHTDAAQSFCKYDIDVERTNIDLLTMSGHKIGSPKGIGALYVRDTEKLQPIIFGSGDVLFPGTKPTPLICAFAGAVKSFKIDRAKIKANFGSFVAELLKIEKIHINSSTPSHIVSVSIDGVLLKDLQERMEKYSFSAGCSCLGQDKSNVISAIDPENKLPSCTIRISFSDQMKEEQLINFARKLKSVVEQLRQEKKIGKGCQSMTDDSKKDLSNSLNKIQDLIKKGKKYEQEGMHRAIINIHRNCE
ncbi:MAG: aminotransferase class V-fold PLP-dependent enzyme [Holosporaceae bacterium]|nr:aminotransferase class V-fold PLP-dependent enzyme [Holosporaceae bacterium]